MSTAPPPQAPSYPSIPDDIVKEVDDSEYTSGISTSSNPPTTMNNSTDTTSTSSSSPTFKTPMSSSHTGVADATGNVPKVPLPVASGKSRLRALLMWEDRKFSAVMFAMCLLFFYLTLWKSLSILSVVGAFLGMYLCVGLLIVQVNVALNGPLDKYIKKPPRGEMFFREEIVQKWSKTFLDLGNYFADEARDVLYCEDWQVTLKWIGISFGIYVLGIWFSPLVLMFIATIGAFSLPLAYHKNKKQVDETAQKAYDASVQKASQAKEAVAQKAAPYLEKAHPAVRNTAEKMGLTPQRKKVA